MVVIVSCHLFLFLCDFSIFFIVLRLFYAYKSTKQHNTLRFQGERSLVRPCPARYMSVAQRGAANKETVSAETPAPWRSPAMHIQQTLIHNWPPPNQP